MASGSDWLRSTGGASGASDSAAKRRENYINLAPKLSAMIQSDPQSVLSSLANMLKGGSISEADFTANGNSVKNQSVVLQSGGDKVEVYFSSRYEPTQITNPTTPIKTGIYANVWKNGQPVAIRTITESKTKSVKSAKTQYENMLDVWKKATGQKQIRFR